MHSPSGNRTQLWPVEQIAPSQVLRNRWTNKRACRYYNFTSLECRERGAVVSQVYTSFIFWMRESGGEELIFGSLKRRQVWTYALKRSLHINYHANRGCHLVVWETNPAFDHHSSSPIIFCMTDARKYWPMYQRRGWRGVGLEHFELRCETGQG